MRRAASDFPQERANAGELARQRSRVSRKGGKATEDSEERERKEEREKEKKEERREIPKEQNETRGRQQRGGPGAHPSMALAHNVVDLNQIHQSRKNNNKLKKIKKKSQGNEAEEQNYEPRR